MAKKDKILLIDDELSFHENIKFGHAKDFHIDYATTLSDANQYLRKHKYNLILLDLALQEGQDYEDGLKMIPMFQRRYSGIPLLIVTNDNRQRTTVKALQLGASNFLYKGKYDRKEWSQIFRTTIAENPIDTTTTKAEKTPKETKKEKVVSSESKSKIQFIGETPKAKTIRKQLESLGNFPMNVTVLITGETGVGKEVAAKYLHEKSKRKNKPFVAVNLSAIPEGLLESELFGHKKGSFTGAITDKKGSFHQANGGVLFLDEIGDVKPHIQIKLLRFLEDRKIRPVGTTKDIVIDVQIVAATNVDILKAIQEDKFRLDFYQRLNGFSIDIPPLKERKSDIPLLLAHFLEVKVEELQKVMTPNTLETLKMYDWSGNIRELNHAVKAMNLQKAMNELDIITEDCLPLKIKNFDPFVVSPKAVENKNSDLSREARFAMEELQIIENGLSAGKKKSVIAEKLDMKSDDLRYKVVKYYKDFPALFKEFPTVYRKYKRSIDKELKK